MTFNVRKILKNKEDFIVAIYSKKVLRKSLNNQISKVYLDNGFVY